MYRLLATFLLALVALTTARAAELPAESGQIHLGVAACSSPLCHGAVAAGRSSRVRQDEYRIWRHKDRHSRAYKVLLEERSKRITERLGLGAPETETVCLNCHATNVPADKRGERFQISDGVSCEACHGGAGGTTDREGWIASHTKPETAHADNVRRGMYPTEDAVKRAELCLSCHLGTDAQFVDHRMMAAGHPRLTFELETFTQIQPAHHRIDDDYEARKGEHVVPAAKTWAIGQLVTAREYLAALVSPVRGRTGAWPEFALYDCYSCHQLMRSGASKDRASTSAGALPMLGTESLHLVGRILPVIDPASGPSLAGGVARLEQDVRGLDYRTTVADLLPRIDAAITATGAWTAPAKDASRLLAKIATSRSDAPASITYAQAEQLTMAAQALSATIKDAGASTPDTVRLGGGVDRLFTLTRSDSSFDAAKFRDALRQLTTSVPP